MAHALLHLLLSAALVAAPLAAPSYHSSRSGSPPVRAYLPYAARSASGQTVEMAFSFSQVVQPGQDPRLLAVAFHSLQFIDAQAAGLGQLTFGTAQANALQGTGWYGNETCPGIGAFQWAGGSTKSALLRVPIPPGTEGLLLHIQGITDGLWMTVRINGTTAATMPVDAYWHQGFVPVGAVSYPGVEGAAPQWPEGRYFPQFTASDSLYAIRVRTALSDWPRVTTPDWRISQSFDTMMALTLVGMQGVINRRGAAVYLDWEDEGTRRNPSRYWLSVLRSGTRVVDLDLDTLSAFRFLYRRFMPRFSGIVIYDPQVPDTINVATMIAGLDNRLILAPEQLTLFGIPQPGSVTDLRTLASQNAWDTTEGGKHRLYQWVYQQLWPRLNRRIVGLISPGPPTSREIEGVPGVFYALGLASRDYVVALQLSALWLSPLEEPQASLFARFVQEADSPIPLYGNFANDEVGTTALASRNGDWNAAITIGNAPLAVGNLTVLSSVRPDLVRYQAEIDAQRILDTLGQSPVLTLWASDGDAMIYTTDRGFHGGVDFYWEGVQGNRFGWTTNPTLADTAPIIWNDYVSRRSEPSLMAGLSGCGYMYPSLMSEAQLTSYLHYASRYLSEAGIRVLHVSNRFGPDLHTVPGWVARRYAQGLAGTGYLGSFVGLSGWPWGTGFYYDGAPSPLVPPSYVLRPENGAAIIEDLQARTAGEYMVDLTAPYLWQENASGYPWQRGEVVSDPEAHAGLALRFSRNDAHPPGMVVWGPFSALAPGNYETTFRLKVAEKYESWPVANISVGFTSNGAWHTIVERSLAPSGFAQAGEYQDHKLSFRLEGFQSEVEFRIHFHGGQSGHYARTDLYADYVRTSREGGLDLPVCAAAFIALVGPVTPLDQSLEAIRHYQDSGGLVLTPDEFMAMLNPEFMIEFARPLLGSGHAALAQAESMLRQGRYLDSLLTVRAALRTIAPSG